MYKANLQLNKRLLTFSSELLIPSPRFKVYLLPCGEGQAMEEKQTDV